MIRKLYGLFAGTVLFATLLTGLLYIWALNRSTVYERATAPSEDSRPQTP